MGIEDPNFWAAMLGGGIIGAVISGLTTIFFGERWAEKYRMRREHSLKLMNEVLLPWVKKYNDYCKIGVEYSADTHKLTEIKPQDPADLDFFDASKSHLSSKYPEILETWKELKDSTFEQNKEVGKFMETIRTLMIEEIKLPQYPSHGKIPKEYINYERILTNIYEVMAYECRTDREWFIGKPKAYPVQYPEGTFYELHTWGSYSGLFKSENDEEAQKIVSFIYSIVQSPDYKQQVKQLVDREDKMLPVKRKNFEDNLKELIKSIELGNLLKGKCKYCP